VQVTLIHNPEAGEGSPTPDELCRALESAGHRVRAVSSRGAAWEAALTEPADVILVAGGDGTVAKVVPRLGPASPPLALLPLGTANNVALTLGRDGGWQALVAALGPGRAGRFDHGTVTGPWGAGSFVESVGAGVFTRLMATADAEPVEAALARRPIPHRLDAIRRLCALLLEAAEAPECGIEADGIDLSGRYVLVEIMNIRSIGPRLRLAPDADPGDGLLDLVLVDERSRRRFAAHVEAWLDNGSGPAPWPVHRARRVRVEGRGLRWHVDDELRPEVKAGAPPAPVDGAVTVELTDWVPLATQDPR
jgi:diacylglycerol kinase family enzyme